MRRVLLCAAVIAALSGCKGAADESPQDTAICASIDRAQIAALFERWNVALKAGSAEGVDALYADDALLLPTLSDVPRNTRAQRIDYFRHFLARGPEGHIDERRTFMGCDSVVDTGLYTFRFRDGSGVHARYTFTYGFDGVRWRITSHHSSLMPEREVPED